MNSYKKDYIPKLITPNFYIGSFDVYLKESIEMLRDIGYQDELEIMNKIKKMPSLYRAAIVRRGKDSDDDKYIGYIGISNINFLEGTADLEFETYKTYPLYREEIITYYLKYLKDRLNIHTINNLNDFLEEVKEEKGKEETTLEKKSLPQKYIGDKVEESDYEIFKSWGLEVPNLSYARKIVVNSKFLGIIGLTNVSAPNKRATLCFYLTPDLGPSLISQFGRLVIDEYLDFVNSLNFYNIESVASDDTLQEEILLSSKMKKSIMIPFGSYENGVLKTKNIFQSTPNIEKFEGFGDEHYYQSLEIKLHDIYDFMFNKIPLKNGFYLVRPKAALKLGLDFSSLVSDHIDMLSNRDLALKIGEDRYFLEKGNPSYGVYKDVLDFSYLIVDSLGNYAGFVNILKSEGHNALIGLCIAPFYQGKGLGHEVLKAFYKELFNVGYVSVTSQILNFNEDSLRLFSKFASFNGIRISSYYANNCLYDIYYYTNIKEDLRVYNDADVKGLV